MVVGCVCDLCAFFNSQKLPDTVFDRGIDRSCASVKKLLTFIKAFVENLEVMSLTLGRPGHDDLIVQLRRRTLLDRFDFECFRAVLSYKLLIPVIFSENFFLRFSRKSIN